MSDAERIKEILYETRYQAQRIADYFASRLTPPEPSVDEAILRHVSQSNAEALQNIKDGGFVFRTNLFKKLSERTEAERWEWLAFDLYNRLVELSSRAKGELERREEEREEAKLAAKLKEEG